MLVIIYFLEFGRTSGIFSIYFGNFFVYQELEYLLNSSYLTDSNIVFTLKMESVSKNTIFGLKMIVKSGLEKMFLKFLYAECPKSQVQ